MKNKVVKASLISITLILLQTIIFFLTKWSVNSIHLINNSSIDSFIPFSPYFIYFYVSWYILLFLIPFIAYFKNKKVLNEYIILSITTCILVGLTYIIYPTTIIRANFSINNISSYLVNLMYKIDTPVRNCFPSAHCIYSFIFIICLFKIKNINKIFRYFLIFISIMIIPTTLLIKQHVFIDVVGAIIYIVFIIIISKLLIKHIKFKRIDK